METQGIVIWARSGSDALILWCADNGALVYVADRRSVGDQNSALHVGDFVDLRVETVGAMRVGRDLRYKASGADWVRMDLARAGAGRPSPVISADPEIAQAVAFGDDIAGEPSATDPANRPPTSGTGAA